MPCTNKDGIGFWYYTGMDQLTLWTNVLAARKIAAEVEATRIAAEVEAARIAAEVEATRIAAEVEATRIDARVATEVDAARMSAVESASPHRPVKQSPEYKQAEREKYEFWIIMISIHSIWYLQGKPANESPPPQALPARAAERLGNVIRLYATNYPPESQDKKGYTDPRTGGPTCKTNEIIYDAIYAVFPTIAS